VKLVKTFSFVLNLLAKDIPEFYIVLDKVKDFNCKDICGERHA
jgi:hypothetical protein